MTTTTRAAANRPMSAPNVPLVLMTGNVPVVAITSLTEVYNNVNINVNINVLQFNPATIAELVMLILYRPLKQSRS